MTRGDDERGDGGNEHPNISQSVSQPPQMSSDWEQTARASPPLCPTSKHMDMSYEHMNMLMSMHMSL